MFDDDVLEYVKIAYSDPMDENATIYLYRDTKTGVEYFVSKTGGICKRER